MRQRLWALWIGIACVLAPDAQALNHLQRPRANPLMVCLGNEEERLHLSKTMGPIYKLNQLFINEFASANDVRLRPDYVFEVCEGRRFAPSVGLLRLLMLKGRDIFMMEGLDLHQKAMAEELSERAAYIFFNYLAGLQGITAHPQCLGKKIPETKDFAERFQYLEGDQSTRWILKDTNKIERIFQRLSSFDQIMKECEKEKQDMDRKTSPKTPGQPGP